MFDYVAMEYIKLPKTIVLYVVEQLFLAKNLHSVKYRCNFAAKFDVFLIFCMMNVETIGLWAGAAWNALNDANGTLNVKGLKKATKLKEKEVYAAIGWLAREGKVNVAETETEVEVTLL